jgi:hypothetical protein
MQNETVCSQHQAGNEISDKIHIPLKQEYCDESQDLLQRFASFSFNTPEVSEKKLSLLKRLLLLQKKNNLGEIGDPSFLLDENFELSPKNYSLLLEYTKKTAKKLNDLMTQSSDLFSSYLNIHQTPDFIESSEESSLHMCSPSIDSNSTRDSDQLSDYYPSFTSLTPEGVTPRNSQYVKQPKFEINRAWDNEKDKLLIKLTSKYNKDWKKVAKTMSNIYQTKYNYEFLKDRFKQLANSNMKLMKYAYKPEKKMPEQNVEDWNSMEYQLTKKIPNGFKQKSHSQLVGQTRMNLFDSLLDETNNVHKIPTKNERESIHYFYTRDQQMTSKTLEVPWISFDFDKEFGSEDQLFTRITPCHE